MKNPKGEGDGSGPHRAEPPQAGHGLASSEAPGDDVREKTPQGSHASGLGDAAQASRGLHFKWMFGLAAWTCYSGKQQNELSRYSRFSTGEAVRGWFTIQVAL